MKKARRAVDRRAIGMSVAVKMEIAHLERLGFAFNLGLTRSLSIQRAAQLCGMLSELERRRWWRDRSLEMSDLS